MLTPLLDSSGSRPLYEQIYRHIRGEIEAGRLLPGERLPSKRALASHLKVSVVTVEGAYAQGMRHFICGMARGTDLYFAEAVLALRLCRSGVTLEAARPCESQADAWPEAERHRYQAILDQCDFETLVQHRYDRFCMQRRNRYMVDRSALVLSVYDGVPKGGTAQTLAYAMRQGVPVQILDPEQGD